MSIGFIAGAETAEDLMALIEYASTFEGLEEIQPYNTEEHQVILCFRTEEEATAAQWMMDAAGAEGRDGL